VFSASEKLSGNRSTGESLGKAIAPSEGRENVDSEEYRFRSDWTDSLITRPTSRPVANASEAKS
jgi:hypothetical protein